MGLSVHLDSVIQEVTVTDENKIDLDGPPPKWDEALEGLVKEEYRKRGTGLRLDDIVQLAQTHAIRFDDIMATLFEMVLQGDWRYTGSDAVPREITRDEVNKLYVFRRLREEDLRGYNGSWAPRRP